MKGDIIDVYVQGASIFRCCVLTVEEGIARVINLETGDIFNCREHEREDVIANVFDL